MTFEGPPVSSALATELAKVMLPAIIARISANFKTKFARKILKFMLLC